MRDMYCDDDLHLGAHSCRCQSGSSGGTSRFALESLLLPLLLSLLLLPLLPRRMESTAQQDEGSEECHVCTWAIMVM